jgi:diguanylate cyclase (GGDEF)-like protein
MGSLGYFWYHSFGASIEQTHRRKLAWWSTPIRMINRNRPTGKETTEVRLNSEPGPTDLPSVVLLVEPCPNESARLHSDLIANQIDVHRAGDLISAAHALSLYRPQLVLAQLRLPTFGGLELIRWLKKDPATQSIPIILYSDIATAEERIRALEMGAVDFLTKPFISAELIARIRAALKTRYALSILERRAHSDCLTGLANRGVFEENLVREWESCRQQSAPLAVAIVDLDHFKAINDGYGHATGDVVLREVARILACSVRANDLVARYGGEEFVVIARNCPHAAAVMLMKRFRARLSQQVFTTCGRSTYIKVTASIGIATTESTNHSPAELLQLADNALYQAKGAGRDGIWVYDSLQQVAVSAVAAGDPHE